MTRSPVFGRDGRRHSINLCGPPIVWSPIKMSAVGKPIFVPVAPPMVQYQRVQGQRWRSSSHRLPPPPPPLPIEHSRPPSVPYLKEPERKVKVLSGGICSCKVAPRNPESFSLNRFPSTCCCYCCCDGEKKVKGQRGSSNHENSKRQPSGNKGRTNDTIGSSTHAQTSKQKVDARKLLQNESTGNVPGKPKFQAITTLEDIQAIRCAEFHPRGHVYAVGSNSKTLRVCAYPDTQHIFKNHVTHEPLVLFKRNKHHRGSIYCLGWSPDGNLLATGSNDKVVKMTRFDDTRKELGNSGEIELTMHDGTVRDLCFIEDLSNKASLLVSGGAGDCKIYVTDCMTSTPFQAFSGHSAPILSLYNWGGVIFASGSQDKTIRLWDLRARDCVNMISPLTAPNSTTIKSPVGTVAVEPTGRLLISGHEDGAIVLFDIRGNRQIQSFKPHASDVKSVRFSPNAYYLLSAGYDQRLMLTDLQGDLSQNLTSVVVGSHNDRVISGRWHPSEFSFLSTSADKTATLWALNP